MKSTTLTALLIILFLAGCGQSGPLYIPGDPSSIEPPAEQAENDEERDDDAEDSDQRPTVVQMLPILPTFGIDFRF